MGVSKRRKKGKSKRRRSSWMDRLRPVGGSIKACQGRALEVYIRLSDLTLENKFIYRVHGISPLIEIPGFALGQFVYGRLKDGEKYKYGKDWTQHG